MSRVYFRGFLLNIMPGGEATIDNFTPSRQVENDNFSGVTLKGFREEDFPLFLEARPTQLLLNPGTAIVSSSVHHFRTHTSTIVNSLA